MSEAKDFNHTTAPDWCPGCGDFGLLAGLKKALPGIPLEPHQLMVVSGIGCSSNLPGFVNTYGMHTLHGRALPIAQGFKLANHKMTVLAVGGDGDGYGIGMGHLVHAMRRNIDMTYLIMNNSIYGLTTGQTSPTSGFKMKTKSTPFGNPEVPINPLTLAMGAGCSFVARAYTGHVTQLVEIIQKAIRHQGFSLVDTFSPCVTFNKVNTHQFYKDHCKDINQEGHDTSDIYAAFRQATCEQYIATGIFYESERPCYESAEEETLREPLVNHKLGLSEAQQAELMAEFV
ncbi:MAG: 2-oxoacid ferredoxin oxidoreductase [Omnitrophica bacterium RIFCSPLOWO2_01_FULL_50_24]|nr:MAG: 2-oxoacid ferredoxin oxidoreductase [Omnitrophica bacterium RIFCSPLOWO2_01_FULL_50_24]